MYNQNSMYNMPFTGVVPYCPFMNSMYMMPNMMRSEDINYETDASLAEDLENNEDLDLREDINEIIEDEAVENVDDAREDLNSSTAQIEYDDNQFRSPNDVDQILRRIEKNNPMLIRRLVMYGVPYPVAIRIVRRVIYLTLQYER